MRRLQAEGPVFTGHTCLYVYVGEGSTRSLQASKLANDRHKVVIKAGGKIYFIFVSSVKVSSTSEDNSLECNEDNHPRYHIIVFPSLS